MILAPLARRVVRRRPRYVSVVLLISVAGCSANWKPLTLPRSKPLNQRTVVEFHIRDSLVRLHGVRIGSDSLSGIPWLEHLSCDTCRVSFALSGVSEMRTGDPGASAWVLLAPLIALYSVGLILGLAFFASEGGS